MWKLRLLLPGLMAALLALMACGGGASPGPTATPTPTLGPTQTLTPTGTPSETSTPTPVPTPSPQYFQELEGIVETVGTYWPEVAALFDQLIQEDGAGPEVAYLIASTGWVREGFQDEYERATLEELLGLALRDPHGMEIAAQLAALPWVRDGITPEESLFTQRVAFELRRVPDPAQRIAMLLDVLELPFAQDAILTQEGVRSVLALWGMEVTCPHVAETLLELGWLERGVASRGADFIGGVAGMCSNRQHGLPHARLLVDQDWFRSSLDEELFEYAYCLVDISHSILGQSEDRRSDLALLAERIRTPEYLLETMSVGQGELELFVVYRDEAEAERALEIIALGLPHIEWITAFPPETPRRRLYLSLGAVTTSVSTAFLDSILISPYHATDPQELYHELTHYYYNVGPTWFTEGMAELVSYDTMQRVGDAAPPWWQWSASIDEERDKRLDSYRARGWDPLNMASPDPHGTGFLLLSEVWQLIGRERMRAAFGELRDSGSSIKRGDIEAAFVRSAPESLKEAVRASLDSRKW